MRGYDVFAGDHYYFAKDAASALRFAEFWASVGCDALFFEAEELPDAFCRYGRVSYHDMTQRVYYDHFLSEQQKS